MRLFDHRDRPIAATAPTIDEIRLRNLVATRCGTWRDEPSGIPRAPDLAFFRVQLGREPHASELTVIKRLWLAERRSGGVGGGHGIATHDAEAPRDPLERFDAAMRRRMR